VVSSEQTGKGHRLKYRKINLNLRTTPFLNTVKVVKNWNRMSREFAQYLCLYILKTELGMALSN